MKRRSSNRTLCVLPSSCSILVLLLWLPASAWAQSAARLRGPWFFDRPPEPVLETSEGLREAALLQRGITALRERKAEESVDLLEAFIAEHPSSVWVPSLRANLGRHYGEQGAYTRALQHWESAWEATKGYADGPGKRVADYVLAKWTRKLLGLGRVEELGVLLAEAQGRRLDAGPLQQMLIRTREAYGVLKESPASSYRCGWVVLDELLRRARGKGLELSSLKEFYTEQNLFQSCSMQTLVQIGQDERWPLAGVERPDSVLDLPYPAVMHMKLGHYMLLLGVEGGLVLGDDPLLGLRYYRPEVLNEEASGRFLVRSGQIPDGWRQLSADELLNTVGRCSNLGYGFGIFGDGWETTCDSCPKGECPPGLNNGPTTGSGGGSGGGCLGCGGAGGGMVRWKVTEPNINLWLQDEPISCQPAYGPAVGLQLSFKQRDEIAGLHTDVFGFGAGWNCGWLAFVDAGNMYPTYTNLITAILNMPGGGSVNFDLSSSTVASEYYYNSRLTVTWVGNVVSSFTWDLPDGRQYIFQQLWSGQYFYLTKAVDREGFATHFNYTVDLDWNNDPCGLRLTSLTDHVGSTLYTLGYTSAGNSPYLVSSAPYNRSTRAPNTQTLRSLVPARLASIPGPADQKSW